MPETEWERWEEMERGVLGECCFRSKATSWAALEIEAATVTPDDLVLGQSANGGCPGIFPTDPSDPHRKEGPKPVRAGGDGCAASAETCAGGSVSVHKAKR
jgi:hypothetical protein